MGPDVDTDFTIKQQIKARFAFLYRREIAFDCLERLTNLLNQYGHEVGKAADNRRGWDESDAILITYGDVINAANGGQNGCLPLLQSFLDKYLGEIISTVHILPFFPSSSDAGFSVIDYKKVQENMGSWNDIEHIADKYRLMVDMVINHTSRFSPWFINFQRNESPGKDYFIEVDPDEDFSAIVRPRDTPLITPVETNDGLRHVWTTFSDDQIDLDFSNPDVLFEFIDIFLFYYQKGVRVFRLDAIAYLWKKKGTGSIHLEETHQVVKLFRNLVECIDPDITLITETNVPFEDNISYFGEQDEAHMIYQFSLPPLLLHAILTENAQFLTRWASNLPDLPAHCTYFNFTASHDGIGVRPLEGLVPDDELEFLVESTQERGGFVSYKSEPDGGKTPYELNITYFDAFEDPGHPRTQMQMKRYLCSQIIMLSLKGVPGIYFHSLMATKNNIEGVSASGTKRDINRKHWQWQELVDQIENPEHINHFIFNRYRQLIKKRARHRAFHPSAKQNVLHINDRLFAFVRTATDESEKILVISNVSSEALAVEANQLKLGFSFAEGVMDLIDEQRVFETDSLQLEAFQTVWLAV